MKKKLILAVDCDGTLWHKDVKYPACGTPKFDIIEQVKLFKKKGAKIILWTCRSPNDLEPVIEFCKKYKIKYECINSNCEFYHKSFAYRKIFAHYYIDDQNLSLDDFKTLNVERFINEHQKR